MTINRDFAENLRAGGDLSGTFDITGDLGTFNNLTVNTGATVPYDNSISGLTATNIQSAITELNTLLGGGNIGSQATWNVYEFTTVGNDTSFDISTQGSPAPSYVPGYVKVYLNGLLLSESDYTAVDGSTVNFSPAIVDAGQIVSVVVLDSFNTAELLRVTSIDASASTNTLVIDSNSHVGIGENTPANPLHVTAASTDVATFETTGAYTFLSIENATRNWALSVGDSFSIYDKTGAQTRLSIDNAGKVGIGTDSPNEKLDVRGDIVIDAGGGSNTASLKFTNDNERSRITSDYDIGGGGRLGFWTDTTSGTLLERLRIDNEGLAHLNYAGDTAHKGLVIYKSTTDAYTANAFNDHSLIRLRATNVEGNYAGITYTHTGATEFFTGLVRVGATTDITDYVFQGFNGNTDAYQEYMRIDSSGNVGIGTTSPLVKLDVQGSPSAPATSGTAQTGSLRLSQTLGDGVLDMGFYTSLNGTAWLQSTNKSNLALNYDIALQPNGGNVGIGVENPDSNLHIKSTSDVKLTLETDEDSDCWINLSGATSEASIGYEPASNKLMFANAADGVTSNVRMTIDADGNVGIGTTSPDTKLEVLGDVSFSDVNGVNKQTFAQIFDYNVTNGTGLTSANLAINSQNWSEYTCEIRIVGVNPYQASGYGSKRYTLTGYNDGSLQFLVVEENPAQVGMGNSSWGTPTQSTSGISIPHTSSSGTYRFAVFVTVYSRQVSAPISITYS